MTARAAELLGLLPEDGSLVLVRELMQRAYTELGLRETFATELLGLLSASKGAAVETIGGWQFARRTSAAEAAADFPLRRRPHRPPPRFVRRTPRPEVLPVKAARSRAGGAR